MEKIILPHKGRGGPKFKERKRDGRRFPSLKYKCELRHAPNCKGIQNAHTAKDAEKKVCNRCYQSLVSSKERARR